MKNTNGHRQERRVAWSELSASVRQQIMASMLSLNAWHHAAENGVRMYQDGEDNMKWFDVALEQIHPIYHLPGWKTKSQIAHKVFAA